LRYLVDISTDLGFFNLSRRQDIQISNFHGYGGSLNS